MIIERFREFSYYLIVSYISDVSSVIHNIRHFGRKCGYSQKVFPRAAANVIGMVHALPMPATPLYEGGRGVEAIVERATAEARLYSGTIPTT